MQHPDYWLDLAEIVISPEMNDYLSALEIKTGIKLNAGKRAWYVKKLESQKEDMKREFPSLPEESWETSLDGNYFSSYLTKARKEGRITKLFYDSQNLFILLGILVIRIRLLSGCSKSMARELTYWNITRTRERPSPSI